MTINEQSIKDTEIGDIIGVRNQVPDTTILTGLWISSVIGASVTLLFCILQRTSLLYKYRLVANHVRIKPPKLRERGFVSLIDWAIKSISVSDVDFIQSAGLDALIMVKMCALGVQLFLPLCIMGVTVLIPLHWTGGASKDLNVSHSGFMRLTMSNIPQGSPVFWVHVVFVYLYLIWAMALLRWHYHQYLTIRQHYLRKGDDVNVWRALYETKDESGPNDGERKIGDLLRNVALIKAFMPSGVPVSSDDSTPGNNTDDDDGDDGEDVVFPLSSPAMSSIPAGGLRLRRRLTHGSLAPGFGSARWSVEGMHLHDAIRRSEIAHRPAGADAATDSLARRSLPQATGFYSGGSAPMIPMPSVGSRGYGRRGALSIGPRMGVPDFDGGQRHGSHFRHHVQLHHMQHRVQHLPNPELQQTELGAEQREGVLHQPPPQQHMHLQAANQRPMSSRSPSMRLPQPPRRLFSVASIKQAAETDGGSPRRGASRIPQPVGADPLATESKGPVGEGSEDPQGQGLLDPAAASRVAPTVAAVREGEPVPPPSAAHHQHHVPARANGAAARANGAASEVCLQLEIKHDDIGFAADVRPSPSGGVVMRVSSHSGNHSKAGSLSSPPDDDSMSRTASELDPDAHLLQWWLERREVTVPLSGKSPVDAMRHQLSKLLHHNIGNGDPTVHPKRDAAQGAVGGDADGSQGAMSGAGGDADEDVEGKESARLDVAVDLTRPSVGHRKTVNAEYPDGTRVAVLAQHYTVLVTDVTERRRDEGSTIIKTSGVQDQVSSGQGAGPASRPSPRRLASLLPYCLRSWCNFQYGKQAAQKLNTNLRHTLSSEFVESRVNTGSLATAPMPPGPRLEASSDGHGDFPSQSHHRRAASNTDSHPQLPVSRSSASGRNGLERGDNDAGHQPVRRPATLGRSGTNGSGKHGKQNPGGGGTVGDKLLGLLEMMARDAKEKLAAQTGSMAAGTPRSSTISQTSGAAPPDMGRSPSSPQAATVPRSRLRLQTGAPDSARVDGGGAPGEHAASESTAEQPSTPPAAARPVAEGLEDPGQCNGSADALTGAGPIMEGQGGQGTAFGDAVAEAAAAAITADAQATVSPSIAGPAADVSSLRHSRRDDSPTAPVDGSGTRCVDGGDGEAPERGSLARSSRGGGLITAAERWEFVRQAVWDGRVSRLPWRSRYSVVSATFLRLFPEEFDRAIPVINFKEVDQLLMRVDQHLAQYEYALKYEEDTGKELFGRLGFCGLTGERRRMKDYHREEVNKLLEQAREARLRAFDTAQTPSWFVFFRTQRAAAMASQCIIHAEDNRQFRVHPAPGPDEVNWSCLWSNFRDRDLRRNMMRPLVILIVLFPIGIFTGALTQLDYLLCPTHVCAKLDEGSHEWLNAGCTDATARNESHQLTWPWYCNQADLVARLLKRVVVAWLPSLLLALWQGMVLPLVFTFVVQVGREARSLSDADRCIARNMFYFAVFNVFLGGVAGSTIIQGINSAIEKGPTEIFNLIGTYVPTSSNFFINYTMFRAFVAVPLRMLWPHIGIRMYLIRRYLRCSCTITPRERAFLMAPVSPRYGFEVGMVMIVFLVAFAFSVVSPLLLVMAMLFFIISWLFWRWALLYVYVRKYEGGGTMWPFVFNRVMVCMAIFPVFTSCVLITKHAYLQAIVLLLTFPIMLVRFHTHCYYRFETGLKAMPLEATVTAPEARVEPWVYTPPPLLFNLAGWHPDWSKCWMGWNAPVVYG